jgi:hypothetical protein
MRSYLSFQTFQSVRKVLLPAVVTAAVWATAGCGLNQFGAVDSGPQSSAGAAIVGSAHGGNFPLVGATVTLWYPGVTGYGSAPTALKSVTTVAQGAFTFPANSYTCPASDMPVYLTITGGNPGLANTANWTTGQNTYAALMAYLGPCSGAGSDYAIVNEATTVGTVFAVAQFMGAAQAANGTSQVNSYTVSAGGSAYTASSLTVTFTGGGCSTEPTAASLPVTSGAVTTGTYITTSVAVGCTSAPTVTLSGAGGSGATATANFSPVGGSGSVGGTTIGSVSGTTAANGGNIGAPIGTVTSGTLTVTNPLAYTDLKNAFATTGNLVIVPVGGVAGQYANETIESAKINTIANILAACVQTDGVTADSSICSNLAAVTPTGVTPTGLTVPTDTVQIATYMALAPTTNVTNVFNNFATPQPIYQTALSTAPFDWTIGITYSGLGLSAPQYPAVDAQGNVWIGNGTSPVGLIQVTPLGQLGSGSPYLTSGYSTPSGMIVDPRGHVWTAVRSSTYNNLSEFNPTTQTQTKYTAQTGCVPTGIAINPNLDVLYSCSTITSSPAYPLNGLQNTGTISSPVYGSTSTIGNISTAGSASPTTYPTALSSDIFGNIFVPEYIAQPNAVVEMVPSSFSGTPSLPTTYAATTYTSGTSNGSNPASMGIDHAGNLLYAASSSFNKATLSSGSYTIAHNSSTASGGLNGSRFGVIDGAGSLWVANSGSTTVPTSGGTAYFTVSGINNAGVQITPTTTANVNPGGYTHNYGTPRGIAVDGSGNIWVPNFVATTSSTNQITEIVGASVPVYTPLGAAPANNRLGTLP